MIRYKIICDKNTIICEKRDKGKTSFIEEEKQFIDIIEKIIEKGYKVTFDGKNLILNGEGCYIFIQNYNHVLTSPCLRNLRDDILQTILADGYMKSSDKKNKKKKRYRDSSIISVSDSNEAPNYFSKNKGKLFGFYFRHILEYALLVTLTLNVLPVHSHGSAILLKNPDRLSDIPEEYLSLYLNDLRDFQLPDFYMEKIDNSNDIDEFEEPVVEEENHDEEYREAIYNFLVKEELTLDQFSTLLTSMVKGNSPFSFEYQNELEVFLDLCFREERTYEEKMLITMIRDGILYDELDAVCAGCVSEAFGSGECYDDAYAVASTIINRTHDASYVANYGTNPYNQFVAPRQFSVYKSKDYLNYLGCIDLPGYQGAIDAFYTRESWHNRLEFRGNWVDLTCEYLIFVDGGNKYIVKMKDSSYVPDEEFNIDKDEIMSLVLAP